MKIGFIGAGNMATAIIKGVIGTKTYEPSKIFVYDVFKGNLPKFEEIGVLNYESGRELAENCDIIFLSVKPQNFEEVLAEIKPAITEDKIIVTIAAGISSKFIQNGVGCECPVIRVMPNTPLLIGKGATAMSRTEQVTNKQFALIKGFFESCGIVSVMDEEKMNAVISVNGSSPAYIYLFAKAMLDSAVNQGISKEAALPLICQSLIGSAGMLLKGDSTPEELIKAVSSPGGTTLEALKVFEDRNLTDIVDEAMLACTRRAEELGK